MRAAASRLARGLAAAYGQEGLATTALASYMYPSFALCFLWRSPILIYRSIGHIRGKIDTHYGLCTAIIYF